MIEAKGNLFEYPCSWLLITTNGIIDSKGLAVMGAGVALEAKKRWPDLPKILAHSLKEKGNTVSCLAKRDGKWIIAFPTKTDWKKPSDPFLIEQSCRILKLHWSRQENKPIVAMSRPGCGNGGLKWPEVKPILEKYFQEDEFVVVNNT